MGCIEFERPKLRRGGWGHDMGRGCGHGVRAEGKLKKNFRKTFGAIIINNWVLIKISIFL